VHGLHENYAKYRLNGIRYRDDSGVYTYGALNYPTNLRKHMNMNLKRFMVRAVIALYPGLSRKGIRVIIRGITNDRQHEQEIEFFHKKTSRKRKNEAYVIRAAIIEHRAVLGLVNPQEKISDRKKDEERCYPLILRNFVFFDRELERKADMELSRGKCAVGETQGCGSGEAPQYRSIMLRQVTRCDYRLHNPLYHHEGDQSRVQCMQGEVHPRRREIYRMNIFDFKRLNTSKKKLFTGMIECDGVAVCGDYRRLKADRPVPSSASPLAKHEENKEAGSTKQEVQEDDCAVGADPGTRISYPSQHPSVRKTVSTATYATMTCDFQSS